MNIGYYYWGFLGDKLLETIDSPDGNAWYSSSIITECQDRGHEISILGQNRDVTSGDYLKYGNKIFNAFMPKQRIRAFNSNRPEWFSASGIDTTKLPKLDILLLEWRFKIPGRNIDSNGITFESGGLQPDLIMQNALLDFYKETGTTLVIFDLDYKITMEDELKLVQEYGDNVVILETSHRPITKIIKRVSVEIPFWIKSSNDLDGLVNSEYRLPVKRISPSKYKNLVYIGSRYERDSTIKKYIIPYSKDNPYTVWFYGNWRNYPDKFNELLAELKWTDIQYHGRVGHSHFQRVYGDSVACPLLAKPEYYQNGFMTARIQEAIYFGSIPIGFSEHYNIEKYLCKELIVDSSQSLENIKANISNIITMLSKLSLSEYNSVRQSLWNNLEFMNVSKFVEVLEATRGAKL